VIFWLQALLSISTCLYRYTTAYNLNYTVQSEPAAGTLALTSASSVSTAAGVKQRGLNPVTLSLYTADLIAAGGSSDGSTTVVTFTYTAFNALFESSVATVSVAVKALVSTSTTPPVGYDSAVSTPENTMVNTTVNVTDADLLDVLTCAAATAPSHGAIASTNNVAEPRQFTYTPAESFYGNDSFAVTCKDQSNAEATVTVTVTVVSINDTAFGAAAAPSTVAGTITTAAKAAYDAWRTTLSSTASFAGDEEALRAPTVPAGDATAWHLSGGDASWADGISTQTRYLIALLGYDHESSNAAATATLTYNITSLPAFGTLHLASSAAAAAAGGLACTDAERFSAASVTRVDVPANTTSYVVTTSPAAEPSLLWYVPGETGGQAVGRAGWVEVRWTVSDGVTGSDGLTPYPAGAASPVSREYAARVYITCASGYRTVADVVPSASTKGTAVPTTSSCVACAPGTYGVVAGAASCAACPLGTYTDASAATKCTDCPHGTFAAATGLSACTPCPTADLELMSSPQRSTSEAQCFYQPGSWREETAAVAVAVAAAGGSNASASAAATLTTCRACPDLTKCDEVDQVIPKIGEAGYWITPTDGAVVVGCSPPDACVSWADTAGVLSGNCSDGYTHGVPGCSECLANHYRDTKGGFGYCTECPVLSWWIYFLGACLFIAVIPIIIRASQMKVGFGAVNIMISYVQVLSMFRTLEFEWPLSVSNFFGALQVFNLDIFTLTPPQCVVSWSYVNKLWMVSLMPILYVAVFGVIGATFYLHYRLVAVFKDRLLEIFTSLHVDDEGAVVLKSSLAAATTAESESESASGGQLAEGGGANTPAASNGDSLFEKITTTISNAAGAMLLGSLTPKRLFGVFLPKLVQGFLLLMPWGYFMLSTNAFEYFNCAVDSSRGDRHYMINNPAMECWNFSQPNLHTKLLPVALLSVLLYPVGIAALFLYILRKHRHLLTDRSRLMALDRKSASAADLLKREELLTATRGFGFLFERYEDEYYYWEVVIMMRKVCYVMVGSLMRSPIEQILTMFFTLTVFSSVFLNFLPYVNPWLDGIECASLISNLFVLFARFLFFSEMLTPEETASCAAGVQALLVVSFIVLGAFFLLDAIPNLRIIVASYRYDAASAKLAAMRARGEVGDRTKQGNMARWYAATIFSQLSRPKRWGGCAR
jgi:hypothetical protein